ncbi:MAG: hypothetical protein WBV94_24775 [Blastocatellia bacterium]
MNRSSISPELIQKALELSQQRIERCEVEPGLIEYYTPCASGKHEHHIVTVAAGRAVCDCPAFVFCKHLLASVGRPALVAVQQLRWARELLEVDEIVSFHVEALRGLPESLKALVRSEISVARRRIEAQTERQAA